MSYYLLHILSGDCFIKKERGNLIYENRDSNEERQIAIEDLRGIILAAPNITLTDQLIRAIITQDAFILHCNDKYQPVGITTPLQKLVNVKVAHNQVHAAKNLNSEIWQRLLNTKIQNQIIMLKFVQGRYNYLLQKLQEKPLNESACARYYWAEYFKSLGYDDLTRRHSPDHLINWMLNYGYAVMGALCHRSLVAHGLSPLFGVHHKGNFHGYPLVYDVIEPWRPILDYYLYRHLCRYPNSEMKDWISESRNCWEHIIRVNNKGDQKLVDAIDYYIQSLASTFLESNIEKIWLPKLIPTD